MLHHALHCIKFGDMQNVQFPFLISNHTQNYTKNVRIESKSNLVSHCIATSIDAKTLHGTVMDRCNVVLWTNL